MAPDVVFWLPNAHITHTTLRHKHTRTHTLLFLEEFKRTQNGHIPRDFSGPGSEIRTIYPLFGSHTNS